MQILVLQKLKMKLVFITRFLSYSLIIIAFLVLSFLSNELGICG